MKENKETKIISHTVVSCEDKEYLKFVLEKLKDYITVNQAYNFEKFTVYNIIKTGCKTILHELNENEILDIGCFTNKNTYYNNNIQKYLDEHFCQQKGVILIEKYY